VIFTDNHAKILACLTDECFHSGSELSAHLGLSRSAIWKYCQSFSTLGVEIITLKGKGYRLNRKLELLSADKIYHLLAPATKTHITTLKVYPQLSSTNDYLLKIMKTTPHSGAICFAESQTHGRGRQGRQWISPFGANIYLSFSWVFENGFASLSGLSLVIGLAVVRALNQLGIHDIGLKWPNDIYWNHQKLGGILIEISGESSGACTAVIGLGLNLYLPKTASHSIQQPWVDLEKIQADKPYSRHQLASALVTHLLPICASFQQKTFKHYTDEWQRYDCMQGKNVFVYRGEQCFQGTVIGVDEEGLFLLKNANGETQRFASGEISFQKKTNDFIN
jgi:BirA family biotin operon repressor/biotin-[acetyl-CoA-carboxylase] ligase